MYNSVPDFSKMLEVVVIVIVVNTKFCMFFLFIFQFILETKKCLNNCNTRREHVHCRILRLEYPGMSTVHVMFSKHKTLQEHCPLT